MKLLDHYYCTNCSEPKFKPEEVENVIEVGEPFKKLKGYRIEFNHKQLNGIFKVDYLNNNIHTKEDRYEKSISINHYHLSDKNEKSAGALVVYDGEYQKHYYTYLNNGDYIQLDKNDFKIFKN